ncbi:hypothetical protein BBJ28_00010708 [Nothophytophthora sp. Chile5]|nr:hypothetical protein BBJ28_00010708 [Nothophytophthora sp. Chile5]
MSRSESSPAFLDRMTPSEDTAPPKRPRTLPSAISAPAATAAAADGVHPVASSPQPQQLYEGPALERRTFDSWDEFDHFMEEYGRRTFQLFRKRTSTSVKLRNRRLADRVVKLRDKQVATAPAEPVEERVCLIPERYANYSVTLVCTHSGAFVSRGTGKRSRQDVRATRCDVQVNACLKLADPRRNRYQIHVTRALLTHNHRVDEETFLQYSNTRLNLPDALLGCVELMRKTGMKPRDIRAYIMANSSCAPTLKDVQNILHRLRGQEEASTAAAAPNTEQIQQLVDYEPRIMSSQRSDPPQNSTAVSTMRDEVLVREYRQTVSAAATHEPPDPVDPTTQFQLADAMGRHVANLLAGVPASEFANAFLVLELAESIVRQRQADAERRSTAASEEGEGEGGVDTS